MSQDLMPPLNYDRYCVQSVMIRLREALGDENAALISTLQFPGVKEPAEGIEEWLAYFPLGIIPASTPRGFYRATHLFQITCAALFAEFRKDGDALRPYAIASIVSKALDNQDIPVYVVGLDGAPVGSPIGVLSIHRGRQQYVNQRYGSASGLPSSLGVGIPLNAHVVALSYRAVTDKSV